VTETSGGLGGLKYWPLLNFRGAAAFATEVTATGRFSTAEEAGWGAARPRLHQLQPC
jgi:hypothetical protein